MKIHSLIYIVSTITLLCCSASGASESNPAHNQALNAVSPSSNTKKENGYLQQAYDKWEKEDWEPKTQPSRDNNVSTTTGEDNASAAATQEFNSSKSFKLQHYFDKWGHYLDEKEKQKSGPSHKEQMDAMPVIGEP